MGKIKIVFTKHAETDKFEMLKKFNFMLTKEDVLEVLREPEHIDQESDKPNVIVSKKLDKNHILRVVYRKEGDIIKIITFYPAEKGRYYK